MRNNPTPDQTPSLGTKTAQPGEGRIPLLPGEVVLSSYPARKGRFYATDQRLLFHLPQKDKDAFRDLSYGEITSVTLDAKGRDSSGLFMTIVFFVGAFIVFVLSRMLPAHQVILWGVELASGTGRFIGLLLSIATLLWGIYRLLDYLSGAGRYIFSGPGLLREASQAALWEVPASQKDDTEAAAFVQTVREQALKREVTRQMLEDMEARLMAALAPRREEEDAARPEQADARRMAGKEPTPRLAFPIFFRRAAWMTEPRQSALEDPPVTRTEVMDEPSAVDTAVPSVEDAPVQAQAATPEAAPPAPQASAEPPAEAERSPAEAERKEQSA